MQGFSSHLGSPAQQPVNTVSMELSEMEEKIGALGKTVEELGMKLGPILRPASPEVAKNSAELHPVSGRSPHADRIALLAKQILGITNHLVDIRNRVDE